jgi:hypothetical protein
MNEMRRLLLLLCSIVCVVPVWAQRQEDSTLKSTNAIIPVRKQNLLKNMDVIANMQFGFNNRFTDGNYTESRFQNNQFRLEIKGKVHDKVSFRFRDRYTRATNPGSLDNLSRSTDLAFIKVDLAPRWSISMGKLCADWGGYEFDANPIDIYEYNDIIEFSDNFLTGFQLSHQANKNNEFTLQLLNSRTQNFSELYGTIPTVEEAKFPVAMTVNWRGNLFDGKWQTIWSYSHFVEAKNKSMHYVAFGNQIKPNNKWLIQYDFKWSSEDLDRKGLVSSMIPDNIISHNVFDAKYVEHWVNIGYRFHPKWNAFFNGFVSNAYWNSNPDPQSDNHLRTSWGFIPGIEYFPFKDLNLKFYTVFVGRVYRYSDYAKTLPGNQDYTTGRISLGFICPLLIL